MPASTCSLLKGADLGSSAQSSALQHWECSSWEHLPLPSLELSNMTSVAKVLNVLLYFH
jgi:hypothetical protein